MRHELKTMTKYFRDVESGVKTFEVRRNDRNFQVGDTLVLREWIPPGKWVEQYTGDGYTAKEIEKDVMYILDDPAYVKEGYVILGFA